MDGFHTTSSLRDRSRSKTKPSMTNWTLHLESRYECGRARGTSVLGSKVLLLRTTQFICLRLSTTKRWVSSRLFLKLLRCKRQKSGPLIKVSHGLETLHNRRRDLTGSLESMLGHKSDGIQRSERRMESLLCSSMCWIFCYTYYKSWNHSFIHPNQT